jgi:hypothetical protein
LPKPRTHNNTYTTHLERKLNPPNNSEISQAQAHPAEKKNSMSKTALRKARKAQEAQKVKNGGN